MDLSPHKNLGAIIGGVCNTSYVLIYLSLKLCQDIFVTVSDDINEDPCMLCFMQTLSLNSVNNKIFNPAWMFLDV